MPHIRSYAKLVMGLLTHHKKGTGLTPATAALVATALGSFRMKASGVRWAIQLLPPRSRRIKPFLRVLRRSLAYPEGPTVVATRFGNGCFEIRNYRETIQRKIYFFGYWERRETLLVRRLLRPGDVFIDVGANLGWFTVLAARCVGPTGKVVSFEPCGRHYEHLQSNLRLNQLTNVIPEKLALSDTAGTAVLSGMHERNEGLGTIIGGSDRRGETVSTVRFDDYWAATGYDTTIRMIKMDIEGAEIKALLGMADTLRRKLCEYLIIEVSKKDLRRAG